MAEAPTRSLCGWLNLPSGFPLETEGAEGDMPRLARHACGSLGGVARNTWPLGRGSSMFSGEYSRFYEREFPCLSMTRSPTTR
jgi:hypothetical protein